MKADELFQEVMEALKKSDAVEIKKANGKIVIVAIERKVKKMLPTTG